jgi:hypothetical protein
MQNNLNFNIKHLSYSVDFLILKSNYKNYLKDSNKLPFLKSLNT